MDLQHHVKLGMACRDVKDPMKDLVEPAVHGTQNVLSSVAKSKDTVKRIIQTSSFAGRHTCPLASLECSNTAPALSLGLSCFECRCHQAAGLTPFHR